MAGLIGWLLSTVWPPEHFVRHNKYNTPLPGRCHVTLTEDQLADRPVFVVGDVHGCFEELCELLQLAGSRRANPFVVFVGDMINKGPQNMDVLRLVEEKTKQGQAACVRGNHEETILKELWSLKYHEEQYSLPERYKWLLDLTGEDFTFLQELPYTLSIPSLSVLVVHGGLVPGKPLEFQSLEDLSHMRNIVQEDYFSGRGLVGSSSLAVGEAWASLWRGPQHVYFGHDARRRLQRWPFATGLDTGCLYGGALTGAFIGGHQEFLSVDAKRTYVEP
ncbi:hypothetical protein ACOMHN_019392 [Nucella lapillus]